MPTDPAPGRPSTLRRFAIWGGGLLLVLSFAGGLLLGRRPIAGLTQRMEQAETRADSAELRLADMSSRLEAYRAVALIHQAIVDLEAQNFGVAKSRLDEAVAALDRVDRTRAGAAATELEAVRGALAGQDIQPTTAPEGLRATLSDLARRLATALNG